MDQSGDFFNSLVSMYENIALKDTHREKAP